LAFVSDGTSSTATNVHCQVPPVEFVAAKAVRAATLATGAGEAIIARGAAWKRISVHRYRICGVSAASDVALLGAAAADGDGRPDVAIRAGLVPPALDGATEAGPTWAIAPDTLWLRVPGIVRFLIREGRRIDYEVEPDAAPGDVAAFVMGGAFGLLLQQRGLTVLSASSVLVDGRAALFMGGSGGGKSTLAAALQARGWPALADDFCTIEATPDGPRLHGDGAELRLWAQAIDRLGLDARRGAPVRAALHKFHMQSHPGPPADAAPPVGAVYALRHARPPFAAGITRPNIVDANLLVRQHAYRAPLMHLLDQTFGYFTAAAAMGNAGGVFQLTFEEDFGALGDTLERLEAHWSGRGEWAGAA
jgi:hypothetical protein